MHFSLDTKELDRFVRRSKRYSRRSIHAGMGFIVENKIVSFINMLGLVVSGRFKNSVNHGDVDDSRVIIEDGTKYGKYLEFGTRAHMIRPKNKKSLHWKDGGDRFSKGHMVSGIQEYAPFRKGLIASIPELEKYVLERLRL